METITYQEKVDFYLQKNHITELSKNDKERLKKLREVISTEKVNLDFNELRYSHDDLTKEEYMSLLTKSRMNIVQAVGYIDTIREVVKKERKEKIKKFFKKR